MAIEKINVDEVAGGRVNSEFKTTYKVWDGKNLIGEFDSKSVAENLDEIWPSLTSEQRKRIMKLDNKYRSQITYGLGDGSMSLSDIDSHIKGYEDIMSL